MYGSNSGGYGSGPQNPWTSGMGGAPTPQLGFIGQRREPGLVLVFSVLTFGVYYLWWMMKVSEEMQRFLDEPDTSPVMELVLTLVTCGFYNIYWDYKIGKKIVRMQEKVGLSPTDNSLIYVLIDFFGHGLVFGMINALMQQGHLNDVWYRAGQGVRRPY